MGIFGISMQSQEVILKSKFNSNCHKKLEFFGHLMPRFECAKIRGCMYIYLKKKSTRFHLDHWLSLPFHIDIGPAVMWVTFGADWGGMEPGSAPRPPAVSGTSYTPTGCGASLTCQLCSAESPHPKQIQQIKHSIEFTLTSVFF